MHFYDHDRELVELLAAFVADGLALGERVVVVATGSHRAALDRSLAESGLDPAELRGSNRFVSLDAADTLAGLMVDGAPDPTRFASAVGALISSVTRDGSRARIFGEMVSLLWDHDQVAAAIELETLWNDAMAERDFSLLCAYPTGGLDGARLSDVRDVCALHTELLPPSSYASDHPENGVGAYFSQVFIPVPQAVSAVRRFVTGVLRLWHEDDLVPDGALVATELASNAIRHADSPFRISVDRAVGVVCIAIQDATTAPAQRRQAAIDADGGRGMAIVEALSRRWGCDDLIGGKVVWAELVSSRRPRS